MQTAINFKSMAKFPTAYSYKKTPVVGSKLPSQTVPGQAFSIQQILSRSLAGKPVPTLKNLHYSGDDYYPPIEKLDLVEREALWKDVTDRIELLKAQLKEETDAANVAAKQAQLNSFEELYERVSKLKADASKDD